MTYDVARMNTRHTADTLHKLVSAYRVRLLESGDVLLPPMRLASAHIGHPGADGKYGCDLLATPGIDFAILKTTCRALVAAKSGNQDGRDQVCCAERPGYVPGCDFLSPVSNYRPQLFVPPIVDGMPTGFVGTADDVADKFCSGAWVMAVVNWWWSAGAAVPGPRLGLRSMLHVLDDNTLDRPERRLAA